MYATFTIHRGKGSMANLDNGNVERGNQEDDGGAGRSQLWEGENKIHPPFVEVLLSKGSAAP